MKVKNIFWMVGVFILLAVVADAILFNLVIPPLTEKKMVQKSFMRDRALLDTVVDYLQNSDYSGVTINSADYTYNTEKKGFMFVDYTDPGKMGKWVSIQDPEFSYAVDTLFQKQGFHLLFFYGRGYGLIAKKGNTIYFQLASTLDAGWGLAYTIDGSAPEMQFLTDYAASSEDHWYYYEEDFNEYKRRIEND